MRIIFLLFAIAAMNTTNAFCQNFDKKIIGYWSLSDSSSDKQEITLEKVEKLKDKVLGFGFLENNEFIIRASSPSSCSTPPIHYLNHVGTWKEIHDGIIKVEYRNRLGIQKGKLFIKKVDDNNLVLQFLIDDSDKTKNKS